METTTVIMPETTFLAWLAGAWFVGLILGNLAWLGGNVGRILERLRVMEEANRKE